MDLVCSNEERIDNPDATVVASVLEILGEDFGETMHFRVGPEMGVEPGEAECRDTSKRCVQYIFIRVQDGEVPQQVLGFAIGHLRSEQGRATQIGARPSRCSHELDNSLRGGPSPFSRIEINRVEHPRAGTDIGLAPEDREVQDALGVRQ